MFFFLGDQTNGIPYGDIYEPTSFGSSGGGAGGGRGGGRIWLNVTNTIHIDGQLTANGGSGTVVSSKDGGGGSGGSIWLHCYRITGFGLIQTAGGKGAGRGGGGAGGRIAMYFQVNTTFSEFRYLSNGGLSESQTGDSEAGGPGTAFLYHLIEDHRMLIVDNNGAPVPRDKYIDWNRPQHSGGRAWILPISGLHDFAQGTAGGYSYEFEELQIFGNAHFAVMPPTSLNVKDSNNSYDSTAVGKILNEVHYNIIVFFKYMIGDRTGSVHLANGQVMDLMTNVDREEMDLPFNTYAYTGSYLGLSPITFVHDVELHLSGVFANVNNMTLRHNGFVWFRYGGRTEGNNISSYAFDFIKVQDDSTFNVTNDPITEISVTMDMKGLTIEGGGLFLYGSMYLNAENVTIDAGGILSSNGFGYAYGHNQIVHGSLSKHGEVNPGAPDPISGIGGGAGHGGTGGKSQVTSRRAGFAYGDLFEPDKMGSSGGAGNSATSAGSGGGLMKMNVTGTLFIDGVLSANGVKGTSKGSGGGSGGSVWITTSIIKGYGEIMANGGDGSDNVDEPGSGGAGGRVAVYFSVNQTRSYFRYQAYGGKTGHPTTAENGGAGTIFLYHLRNNHQTLIIDNDGKHPRDKYNIISDYRHLGYDSCRSWILPESGRRDFANGSFKFNINELQIYGAAHLAVLPEPIGTPVDIYFLYMIGDRTGTMHVGAAQVMDLERPEIDLPFNVRVYTKGYIGLAPFTIVHGVTIWLHGEMDHVENITLHHGGHLALKTGAFTTGANPDNYHFNWTRIQDNATISILTDPVADPQSFVTVENRILMEGGGCFYGTYMKITASDLIIDNGAVMHSDALGYRPEDPKTTSINKGLGTTDIAGSSGAGHGGTSGKGAGTTFTGQPYGHLFQPHELGSAGGGGKDVGGQGGGLVYLEISNLLQIDGEIRCNGGDGKAITGGGGSGGTILIATNKFRGMGNVTANGGGHFQTGSGGGGAGGRIAIYFKSNVTYWGGYQCHGGYSTGLAEPGGPGLVFLYHQERNHSTLYINNDNLQTTDEVNLIRDYTNLSEDRFKGWILPDSSDHWLAGGNDDYRFDELQIYGNAHLALLPYPFRDGCNLHFRHMIGDRTGHVHIGPYQVMDLKRTFLDTPFSSYVYHGGYLGLAPDTFLEKVFLHIEGTVDHVHNLTLIQGGGLRLYKNGSTNRNPPLNYVIEGLTVIKAESYINCSNPNADTDAYQLRYGWVIVEGGGSIKGGNLNITATDFTVDDGGKVDVNDGGYRHDLGTGKSILFPTCKMIFNPLPDDKILKTGPS